MIDKGAIQKAHPEWNVVDAIPATDGSGGIWAVGADGGVFTLDAAGNASGATKFFGAYTQLPGEQRQGNRTFVGIRSDPTTGGYTLISNQPGQNYTFKGDSPIGGDTTKNQPAATKGIDFTDADLNQLTATLQAHGLGDLVNVAWDYYKDPTKGAGSADATLAYLPTTKEYETHFPGLKELADKGNAWTPAQWNTYYNTLQDALVTYGVPAGMLDRSDIGKMLSGNVSVTEALGRIQAAGQSANNADPIVIAKMHELGFTDGDLTAFYLDADKASPLLDRKAQEGQARIAAQAQRTGYDVNLTGATAAGLQKLGVDESSAATGFGQLATEKPLFANLVGETGSITGAEQLGATFGNDTAAQQEIARRRAQRQATFKGGGGAASGGQGQQGIG